MVKRVSMTPLFLTQWSINKNTPAGQESHISSILESRIQRNDKTVISPGKLQEMLWLHRRCWGRILIGARGRRKDPLEALHVET